MRSLPSPPEQNIPNGVMKNIIHRIDNDDRFELTCVIGAAHDSKIFGQTINEIKEMKIKKIKKLKFNYVNSDSRNIMNYFQMMIDKTCKFFDINKIDAALILGDRYEMMAIALTCINYNIPIMHFCGGGMILTNNQKFFIWKKLMLYQIFSMVLMPAIGV